MTYEMKMLFTIGLKYAKHYDVVHHADKNIFTLRIWINDWEHLDFVTSKEIPEKQVLVKYIRQPKNGFTGTPLVSKLDKYCGKKYRKNNNCYSIIPLEKALEIVQKIESNFTVFQSTRPFEFHKYYSTPEEVI